MSYSWEYQSFDGQSFYGSALTSTSDASVKSPPPSVISTRSSRSTESFRTAHTTPSSRLSNGFCPQPVFASFIAPPGVGSYKAATEEGFNGTQGDARLSGGTFMHQDHAQPVVHLQVDDFRVGQQDYQYNLMPPSIPGSPRRASARPKVSRPKARPRRRDDPYDGEDEDDDEKDLREEVRRLKGDVKKLSTLVSSKIDAPGHGSVYRTNGTNPDDKKQTMAKRKSADANDFLENIRQHLLHLMGGDVFDVRRQPSEMELMIFAQQWSERPANSFPASCDIDNFKIELSCGPHTPWNTSASRIFALSFLQSFAIPVSPSSIQKIDKAFFNRLKSVVAEYRKRQKGALVLLTTQSARRRHQRKRGLFLRRRKTIVNHPLLRQHLAIMDKLGIEGMSCDESEGEGTSCTVRMPAWRSEILSDWLHVVDTVYIRERMKSGDRRGSLPRLREYTEDSVSSSLQYVKGLPKNAYRPKWLESAVDVGEKEEYPFVHDNKLFSETTWQHNTASGGP